MEQLREFLKSLIHINDNFRGDYESHPGADPIFFDRFVSAFVDELVNALSINPVLRDNLLLDEENEGKSWASVGEVIVDTRELYEQFKSVLKFRGPLIFLKTPEDLDSLTDEELDALSNESLEDLF